MSNIISLDFKLLDVYNLAIHNNGIPLINEIVITNDSDYDLKNVDVEISSQPSLFSTVVLKVPELRSGRYFVINTPELEIDTTKVMYLSQLSTSVVTIKIKNMGEVICENSIPLQLLPYDYIPELSTYTELISSFVTPHQEEVKIVSARVLEKIKNDGRVSVNRDSWEYGNKEYISVILKAIYDAVRDLKITYNTSSVFTENKHTKVRLPEQVFSYHSANSLEIALFVASVSEFIGIKPFLVFASDKVLNGFFYGKKTFTTSVSDDGRCFSSLIDGDCDTFCVIDPISLVYGTQVTFDSSMKSAQSILNSVEFPTVVDVDRCRKNGYSSLPSRTHQNGTLIFEASEGKGAQNLFNPLVSSSSILFSETIKNELLSHEEENSLSAFDLNSTVLLVGSARQVMSKLLFNSKLSIKSFPLANLLDDNSVDLTKLVNLNANVDNADISNTVSAIHDKEVLKSKLSNVSKNAKRDLATVTLTLGAISYTYNNKKLLAPVFLVPITFTSEGTVNLLTNEIIPNNALFETLVLSGVKFDFDSYKSDVLDKYDIFVKNINEAFSTFTDCAFFDTCAISVFNFYGHKLSKLATPEFFEKSEILSNLFAEKKVSDIPVEKGDEVQDHDVLFSLDSSQMLALNASLNNPCTVISALSSTGKTRVSASIAFQELRRGNKVLYLSNSKGNIRDFCDLAEKGDFDDFVFDFTKETKKNTFDSLMGDIEDKSLDEEVIDLADTIKKQIFDQDSYYQNLHKVNEIGFSLYEAASQYERYRSFPYAVNFTNSDISKLTRDDVVVWFDAVSSIAKSGADCKEPFSNPLAFVTEKNFSYDLKSKATIALSNHISLTEKFTRTQNELAEFFGIEVSIMREKQTKTLLELLSLATTSGSSVYFGVFGRAGVDAEISKIEAMVQNCEDLFELKDYFKVNFTNDIINLDSDSLLTEWRNASSKFAFSRSSALSLLRNKLKAYSLNPKSITNDNFVEILSKISRYKNAISEISENESLVLELTGIDLKSSINAIETNVFNNIRNSLNASRRYLSLINEIYDADTKPASVYHSQKNLFKNTDKLISDLKREFSTFPRLYEEYLLSENELSALLKLDLDRAKEENSKLWYYFAPQFFDRMLDNMDILKYWCNWNSEKERAISLGLENVVKLYESEQITSGDIKNAFLKGFFKSVTEYFLSSEESVSNFSSENNKKKLAELYGNISRYRKIISRKACAKIKADYNSFIKNNLKLDFEKAQLILKNDFSFGASPRAEVTSFKLLQKATPCFVCDDTSFHNLFRGSIEFDTIIVDVNKDEIDYSLFLLLPLAKRLVVISSEIASKRTNSFANFFIKHGAPVIKLLWSYSANFSNSLINELFYDNSLSMFTSVYKRKTGLNVLHQIGSYDRRKTRVNIVEASATVDEIIKNVSENKNLSIGVYTMTEEQRNLVELLLKKRLGTNDAYEELFARSASQPFFVRSFNEALYDPRDVLIFSTVFSAEQKPKYKDSITKTIPELSNEASVSNLVDILCSAKRELTLITSLSKENLEDFKTTEKNYLIFKKTILKMLESTRFQPQDKNVTASPENSMIRQVANHIESLGFKADLDFGINKSKIDIAVRNKTDGNYVLGIVFDETAFVNSDTFLGRDLIIRGFESVGEWKILRIYTIEWFENHGKALDTITTILNGKNPEDELSI